MDEQTRARAHAIAAAAPPPSEAMLQRLRTLLAPAVDAWWEQHDGEQRHDRPDAA